MPLACNLFAIDTSERVRYQELVKRIQAAIRLRIVLIDGYTVQLDSQAIGLPEIAEWMMMERLCCPFLKLQVTTSGEDPEWALTITGPPGVQPILQAAFPSPAEDASDRFG